MDLRQHQYRGYGLLMVMTFVLFFYVFFSPDLDRFLIFTHVNQGVSWLALFYLNHIGTTKVYAYFFIALVAYVICQWHLSHYVSQKALFIALSLAVSVIMVQCAGVFFSKYIEHIQLMASTGSLELIHNSIGSTPGAHVARLVALATSACFLTKKQWLQVLIIAVVSLILVGMGVNFYDRTFISTALAGVFTGFFVPYYLRALLFTQRHALRSK